jgi:carotenoid cleavage dioxygenase-like enzyme
MTKESAMKVYFGLSNFGDMMKYYSHMPCKFVIVPRNTADKTDFFTIDIDPCHIYHYGHAKESDDKIVFTAVALPKEFNMNF